MTAPQGRRSNAGTLKSLTRVNDAQPGQHGNLRFAGWGEGQHD